VAVVLVLAAGTVAAAVGFGSDDERNADRDVADLRPALLTRADLGDEFAPAAEDDDGNDALDLDEADVDEDCRDAYERFGTAEGDDEGNLFAEFERQSDGVGVQHELWLVGADEPTLDELADAWRACDRIAYEEEGRPVEMRMAVEEGVEGIGEEALGLDVSIAFTVIADTRITVEAYGLIAVRDGVASGLFVTGPVDRATLRTGPVDRELARDLAVTADERLQQALD
jgi:hypothetical protein